MLASKNFKRNRKKYRATVISLFISVVLFISATSFCSYLTDSASAIAGTIHYDISYNLTNQDSEKIDKDTLYKKITGNDNVTEAAYVYNQSYSSDIISDMIDDKTLSLLKNNGMSTEKVTLSVNFLFVQDEVYEQWLNDQGYDTSIYMDSDNPQAIVYDKSMIFVSGKYRTISVLSGDVKEISYKETRDKIGEYSLDYVESGDDGNDTFHYINEAGETMVFSEDEATTVHSCTVGTKADSAPFFLNDNSNGSIILLYPYSAVENVIGQQRFSSLMYYMKADNPDKTYDQLYSDFETSGITAEKLNNEASMIESNLALMTVIKIFSYGFIVLISLISVANVFNTISTNVGLRRREFAMLKSVGMTRGGFYKMMNYECVLYGFKGLIFGIPVSIGMTYLIYRSLGMGMDVNFYMPWKNVIIAAGSVFVIVFATMIYSMSKVKNDNPVETLKSENL